MVDALEGAAQAPPQEEGAAVVRSVLYDGVRRTRVIDRATPMPPDQEFPCFGAP